MFPTRVRRRALKHAFEEALDAARLEPEAERLLLDEDDGGPAAPGVGPAVGSLGDIAVAPGYVAAPSLARAYDAEAPEAAEPERPAEAAAKLKAALAGANLSAEGLKRLRRRFAAENHPDRVPSELRDEAVAAMAEVNAEIDRALKRVGSG